MSDIKWVPDLFAESIFNSEPFKSATAVLDQNGGLVIQTGHLRFDAVKEAWKSVDVVLLPDKQITQ